METIESTDPLPTQDDEDGQQGEKRKGKERPFITVGLTYNLKKGIQSDVEDIEAEYDSIDTVTAIKNALEQIGCKVQLFEADRRIFHKLAKSKPDIVFNIAEGLHGRGREAQIPAILNFYGIPYTGSDETTLCLALDKALAKRILTTYKIKTPRYQVFDGKKRMDVKGMKFPLIVKPNAEGSSKGISDAAVVRDAGELEQLVARNIRAYGQSMLVEEFIFGREFTVAVIGNGRDTLVLPPMEIVYRDRGEKFNIYSYNVKKNFKQYIDYICPAEIGEKHRAKMVRTAGKIYEILACRDFARIDFRLSEEGELYFIEINPLPGLAPGYSDFPMIAEFNGIDYVSLIRMVLNSGLKRHGMQPVG